jgi:hypothetical protein
MGKITSRSSGEEVYGVYPKKISVFDQPGTDTWTKPDGCVFVRVQLVGAGGGSSGYCESGGSGGYSEKYIDVSGIDSVQVTVGSGGSHVSYHATAPSGGTTSFGTYLTATGGLGANSHGSHEGGAGGVGSGGHINLPGSRGGGHCNGMGSWGPNTGASSFFGGPSGRRHSDSNNNTGEQNAAPGAGGSGGKTDAAAAGDPGRHGIILVHEFYRYEGE